VSPEPTAPLPEGTSRLFAGYAEDDLRGEEGRSLLLARLLEDGDSADLRWLVREVGAEALGDWLAEHGGRQLSARSRSFWALVLDRAPSRPAPDSVALWPY
jgi:hypothetical protein